uniref:Leptin n=1 Tax=Andrias davidianus TaxID=141262 RepID=A0A1X9IFX4_ANDDA|nr:leptin [Andrias davidianus]
MRYPGWPFLGFLWMWIPAFDCRPIKIDRLRTDAKNLTRTIIARLQDHPCQFLLPMNLKVSGLDFIPGEQPLDSLDSVDETLEIFHAIISSLPLDNMEQILSDIENLRSLLQTLSSLLGCTTRKTLSSDTLGNLTEEYAKSPYTMEKVALDRFQKSLHNIVKHLEHATSC